MTTTKNKDLFKSARSTAMAPTYLRSSSMLYLREDSGSPKRGRRQEKFLNISSYTLSREHAVIEWGASITSAAFHKPDTPQHAKLTEQSSRHPKLQGCNCMFSPRDPSRTHRPPCNGNRSPKPSNIKFPVEILLKCHLSPSFKATQRQPVRDNKNWREIAIPSPIS